MTKVQFGNRTSELIAKHPAQADLLAIATFDAFDEEDESPMLDKLMEWCENVCNENITPQS